MPADAVPGSTIPEDTEAEILLQDGSWVWCQVIGQRKDRHNRWCVGVRWYASSAVGGREGWFLYDQAGIRRPGPLGSRGQAAQDLRELFALMLQQFAVMRQHLAVALLGLADGLRVRVHQAQPVGHGIDLRRERVADLLLQLLEAALQLLNRGHGGRIAAATRKMTPPGPRIRQSAPLGGDRQHGSVLGGQPGIGNVNDQAEAAQIEILRTMHRALAG